MPTFLTVKQAATQTGRSSSSIRRIIYPIIKNDKHADRSHIEPSVEDAKRLRMKGENFAWKISQELLDRQAPPRTSAWNAGERPSGGGGDGASLHEVVTLLRQQLHLSQQQLAVKDLQIATLSEITKSLNDRIREGNVLIATLQRSLPSGEQRPVTDTVDASATAAPSQPVPKSPAAKPTKPVAKKAPKKGFFTRLFN